MKVSKVKPLIALMVLMTVLHLQQQAEARWDSSGVVTPQKVVIAPAEPAKLIKFAAPQVTMCRIRLIRDADGRVRAVKAHSNQI